MSKPVSYSVHLHLSPISTAITSAKCKGEKETSLTSCCEGAAATSADALQTSCSTNDAAPAIHQVSHSTAYSHFTYIWPIPSGLLEHLEGGEGVWGSGEGQLADMGLGRCLCLHCGSLSTGWHSCLTGPPEVIRQPECV